MKALTIAAWAILGLLVVPPLLFLAFYFGTGAAATDRGHPPAIIIPYLYVILGLRFVAPVGMAISAAAFGLAVKRALPFRSRFSLLALALVYGLGAMVGWLHRW